MSLQHAPVQPLYQAKTVEQIIRSRLGNPATRDEIATAVGWKDPSSSSSRVLSGQQGIQLKDMNRLIAACGMVLVDPQYLDWLKYGAQLGANCWCERNNMAGACAGGQ